MNLKDDKKVAMALTAYGLYTTHMWSMCDHYWEIDESDWDGPPDFEYVICSKCKCPGQRHIESGEVEWPTT